MNDNFNPVAHIAKMQPHAQKLINQFKKKGFNFSPDDGQGNVSFFSEEREIFISKHSFYRFSGIACVTRDIKGEKNQSTTVEVTDEMFMDIFMTQIVQAMLDADSAIFAIFAWLRCDKCGASTNTFGSWDTPVTILCEKCANDRHNS